MRSDMSGIAVFAEAVAAGDFSKAAERLNLSRSAVGKTVARLEARLGTRLFHRTTRSQTLTEDGQIFYERCLRALDEVRQGEAMLESGRREVAGRLRISMPVLFGRHCVAPVLRGFAARHPALELDLNFSDRIVGLASDGFDLAIGNVATRSEDGLKSRRITAQRMTVCASPAYLAQHGEPHSLADISRHEAVVYGQAGTSKAWTFLGEAGDAIRVEPRSRLRFDDQEAIADAAAAGFGLAWLPCWLVREKIRSGQLVHVLKNEKTESCGLYAVWPDAPYMPMRLRMAIDHLAATLPESIQPDLATC